MTGPTDPRHRTALLLAVLLGVGALVVAFVVNARDDAPDEPAPGTEGQVQRAGAVSLLRETAVPTGSFGGVGVDERLALLDGGCLGLAGHDPDLLVVFPPGTELTGRPADPLVTAGDIELRLGDRLIGGTRYPEPQPLSRFGDLAAVAPDGCRDLLAVVVSQLEPAPARVARPDQAEVQGAWLVSGTGATVVVTLDGIATYGGCGGIFGGFTLWQGSFDVGAVAMTDTRDCGPEPNVGRLLLGATRARLDGRVLHLTGPGQPDLVLTPRTHEPPDTDS